MTDTLKLWEIFLWRNFHTPEDVTMPSSLKGCGNTYRMTS